MWMVLVAGMFLYDLMAAGDQTILKFLILQTSVLFMLTIRFCLGGGCILGRCVLMNLHKTFRVDWYFIEHTIKGVFCRVFLPGALGYYAVQHIPVAKILLFFNFRLFSSYFLSYLILGDRITWRKSVAIIITFMSGVSLILSKISLATDSSGQFHYHMLSPEIAVFVSVTLMSYGWVEMRKMQSKHTHIHYLMVNAFEYLLSGVIALIFLLIQEHDRLSYLVTQCCTGKFIGWVIFCAFIGVTFPHSLYSWLLRSYSETLLFIATRFIPLFGAVIAWILLGEVVELDFVISAALALIGFGMFSYEEICEAKVKEKEQCLV